MKSLFWVFSLAFTCFASGVSVFTLDEQYSSSNITVLRFKVVNNTGKSLKNVELHYKVVQKTGSIALPNIYYLPSGTASWQQIDGIQTLVVKFPNVTLATGRTLCGEAGCAIGIHNTDWSRWTKNDDPSQPVGNTFALNNNIEVFADGLESTKPQEAGCPEIRFVEVMKDTVSLEILNQKATDSKKLNLVGEKGVITSVDLNNAKNDSLGRKIWRGAAPVQDGVRGEFWAECNGKMLSYFAYGWKPQKARIAVANKLWDSDSSFVRADFDMGFNQGLGQGQRLILDVNSNGVFADARVSSNWKFYRAWEDPGDTSYSIVRYPGNFVGYLKGDIDSLTLEWSDVEGIDWYHLLVVRGDSLSDTVVSLTIQGTSITIPMFSDSGLYVWIAEPLIEVYETSNADYSYAVDDDSLPKVLRMPSWKSFKKVTKKTLENAIDLDLYHALIGSGSVKEKLNNLRNEVVTRASPYGFIMQDIDNVVREKNLEIKKNLTYLSNPAYANSSYNYISSMLPEYDFKNLYNSCPGAEYFCASKDTRVLLTNWVPDRNIDKDNWNGIVFKRKDGLESAANDRCWLTMAQVLNHYYGGSISQDQIMWNVRKKFDDYGGGEIDEVFMAVNYALGLNDAWSITDDILQRIVTQGVLPPNIDGRIAGSPTPAEIILNIEAGRPIAVSQWNDDGGFHAMTLSGYKINANGNMYIYLINAHNNGEEEWRFYCDLSFHGVDVLARLLEQTIYHLVDSLRGKDPEDDPLVKNVFKYYFIPPANVTPVATDERFFKDSDNDGVVDFDEIERFGLDPNKNDTDGDGLLDYDELLDYLLCENERMANLSPFSYAAKHRDSDGDGFCDMQENGHEVEGVSLCERYDASRHPEGVEPECSLDYNLAMLATELVQMNDRAYCVDLQGNYCPVASYDSEGDNPYGVVLGVQAKVGNVYSAKSVFMRDYSVVYGNVETGGIIERQSPTPLIYGIATEKTDQKKLYDVIYAPVLENAVLNDVDFTTTNYRVFNTNETAIASRDLAMGSTNTGFIFNSYSQLIVDGTQRRQTSSLQFQSGAKLNILSGSLELHVGKNFQWNGEIVAESMIKAAQNIIVYYYGTETVYVQTNFAGTIIAPNAEVVVGQAYGKRYYGTIFAKRIVLHQNTIFTWVPYSPSVYESIMAYNVNFF